jgi:hypothetical protein
MPRHATVDCPAMTWTLLTTNNVTELRVANMGQEAIWLQAMATATPPDSVTGISGALPLHPTEILAGDLTLTQLFPGVAGAARIYALAPRDTKVSVSHA